MFVLRSAYSAEVASAAKAGTYYGE